MITPVQRSYLFLHISVFLWGFTAILGAWIDLSAPILVWWRVAITTMVMLLIPGMLKGISKIPASRRRVFIWIGVIVALHWVCFYGAIKMANASVTLICMSTASLFTAFIEPLFTKQKFKWIDLGFGIVIIPAIILTTQGMSWEMMPGFWVGILAAFLAALFAVFNKKYIEDTSPQVITIIEMGSAWAFLTICAPALFFFESAQLMPHSEDVVLLLILAVVCTVVPFILHLKAFEHLSAFASNLIINLEPVYGILLAIILLQEHHDLTREFYFGVFLIFVIVLAYPLTRKWRVLGDSI
ncbi:MAG: drug/metabolite transporter (DMT)-like permease [Saprospiraceae bacterium]|jgi:drug/metabolite transporter (DMT)-like permease